MGKLLRCYLCSDLHAANRTYRKLLNAIRLNIYQADVVLIAGDLTGKAIVPLVAQGNGNWTTSLLGQNYSAATAAEREQLESMISDIGYYPYATTQDEVDDLVASPQRMQELFRQQMVQRITEWVELAEKRIGSSKVQFYMMPGNDDDSGIDDIISQSSYVINPLGKVVNLDDQHELLSFDHANPTPWQTPREWSEDEYYQRIKDQASSLKHVHSSLFMVHVPPYDSGLDVAPQLDENLRPKATMGDMLRIPVGSTGVKRAIQEFQPLVSVHGHVHESSGQSKIGRTTCFNAGSEANQGILRGYILDLGKDKLVRSFRVQG